MRAFHDLRVVLWLFYGCSILVLWLLYGCYILLIELLYLCHTARLYRSDSRYVSSWPFLSGLCFTAPAARALQLCPDVVLHLKYMPRDQRQGKAARCDERCPHPLEESGTTPADDELATRLATISSQRRSRSRSFFSTLAQMHNPVQSTQASRLES